MSVSIIRLKDGTDLICNLFGDEYEKDICHISDPMMFEIRGVGLILQHWLPVGIIKNNSTKLNTNDILCVFEPSNEIVDHYNGMVEKMNNVSMNQKENINENEIGQLMEAISELQAKDTIVH